MDVSDRIWKAKEQGADSTYLVGGELAAAQQISYLSPIGMTLHLQSGLNSNTLAVNLKLKPNPEGTIIFLRDPRKWDAIQQFQIQNVTLDTDKRDLARKCK